VEYLFGRKKQEGPLADYRMTVKAAFEDDHSKAVIVKSRDVTVVRRPTKIFLYHETAKTEKPSQHVYAAM